MSKEKTEGATPVIDDERAAAYERARQANGGVPPKTEDKTPESKVENPPEKKEEVVPPKKEDDGKKPEEKTVPHEALHAERERRKAEQQKNRELEEALKAEKARNDALLEDMNSLLEKGKESQPEDVDSAFKQMREKLDAQEKELKALKAASEKWESFRKDQEQMSAKERMDRDLSETNGRLEKAGYPGFLRFVPLVSQELSRLTKEDPDTAPPDSPEGWEKVYREHVFPTIKGIFSSKTAEKEERKKDADLPTGSDAGHGKPPPETKEKTPEDERREYMDMRRKSFSA